jgi:hypothetical protein
LPIVGNLQRGKETMQKAFWTGAALAAAGLFGLTAAMPAGAADNDHRTFGSIEHVLLISIDGFHALDLANCTASGLCPNLAQLSDHGTTYTNASTTKRRTPFRDCSRPSPAARQRRTAFFMTTAMTGNSSRPAASAWERRARR